MFISPAYAANGAGDSFGMFVPLILIFVVFYFLMIRPQQKKQKNHREMIGALRRGDRIVTNGGLIGSISRVANDNELIVEVASGVKVRVLRSMIAELLSKPQPVRRRAKQEVEDEDGGNEEDELDDEDPESEGDDDNNRSDEEHDSEDTAKEQRRTPRSQGPSGRR
jgi:preprotein translocase subunit YajC